MRRCYLVCYDIRDAKRLRTVHKIMKGYGETWQYSIFFCILKAIDRVRLQADLEEILNLKEDRILIVDLGANEQTAREAAVTIGQTIPEISNRTLVI